jgi:hypothetical protein
MMEIRPLQITVLRPGTFRDYYRRRQQSGSQLAQRRPPRVNASDDIIAGLLRPGDKPVVPVA